MAGGFFRIKSVLGRPGKDGLDREAMPTLLVTTKRRSQERKEGLEPSCPLPFNTIGKVSVRLQRRDSFRTAPIYKVSTGWVPETHGPSFNIAPKEAEPTLRTSTRPTTHWLLRYMHANGASMFLIVVHLLKRASQPDDS
ncbi:apocytochrome b [Trifolium repens]|nr:apocytochrome b [Trifolium repens]